MWAVQQRDDSGENQNTMLCLPLIRLLTLFVGWEGVGLCSYALIGFWYKDLANARAGSKAFLVNRVGDFGFVLGMFALYWCLDQSGQGTLIFRELAERVSLLDGQTVVGIGAATFILHWPQWANRRSNY